MSRTALVPVVVLAVCLLSVAAVSPWGLLALLVPVAVAAWVLRTGVDVTDDGLTVRSLLGSRPVPWSEAAGIRIAGRGELWVVTTGGTEVRLPTLRVRDLPLLAQLSAGRLEVPAPPAR
jgi:hypothetical protein